MSAKDSKDNFVHLHVHTEFSMLDGAARIDELLQEVADQEMPAIAITDHGNNFGAFEFYRKAKKVGVKPIIGIEAYLAPGSRFEKSKVQWADGGDDDITDARVASTRTTEYPDAEDFLCTGVVGDAKSRLLLDHFTSPVVAPVLRPSLAELNRSVVR